MARVEAVGAERAGGANAEAHLHELEVLTDTALGRLDVEELLKELLRRVRDILNADTATVLLFDEASKELVATAALGIEEEVRQGVRVPLGHGFAGRIAATKAPVALTQVDATTVTNPILWEKRIRVMLGVPLLSGDQLLGVLHVGRLRDEPFTARDEEMLKIAAERVAGATQARLLAVEQAAATLLERSLLPTTLPECDGLELAAQHVARGDRTIGGDWYDVFTLPSGALWVIIGDVAGQGLRAAVVMGRIRSAVRAYALVADSPAEVLELADRKCHQFEFGTIVTAICAKTVPPYGEWQIATAGHPPPMLAAPGAPPSLLELPVRPPLGAAAGIERSAGTVELPENAVMLLYTDGLVERRGEPLDVGFGRLRAALDPDPPRDVCRRVLHDLVGADSPGDDIALVAIRRTSS